ncbi:hypothetical protein B0T14DRAFT_570974 [Immersiella caudata]|uniref:Uncharacterized protein n=1 Tax=Immersiella caudata TaxID=314043 RepID=A0AA39THA8_9PEZI|nr:hypothetical protein B0T14DRAFT_570974 [Immersiella caudata]
MRFQLFLMMVGWVAAWYPDFSGLNSVFSSSGGGFRTLPMIFTDAAMEWGRSVNLLGDGKEDWPKVQTAPTFDPSLNLTQLNWVGHCLAQWCETDTFLKETHGRVACRTHDGRPDGGVVGYICNHQAKARCSRAQVGKILHTLFQETQSFTGHVKLQTGPRHEMTFGFDTYCDGDNDKCGDARNPIWAVCENREARHREPMQLDLTLNEKDFAPEREKEYLGISWVNEPTPAPTPVAHVVSVATPTGAPNLSLIFFKSDSMGRRKLAPAQ